jgi:hypothetical protein
MRKRDFARNIDAANAFALLLRQGGELHAIPSFGGGFCVFACFFARACAGGRSDRRRDLVAGTAPE